MTGILIFVKNPNDKSIEKNLLVIIENMLLKSVQTSIIILRNLITILARMSVITKM